ncbi:A/G-specific adenine glycosylase [Chryseobacterium sp.]|uniref:A/G-specific adenine glycosylase n=1 Tax=Chryseobacterium sp. TaxID=1871047 RepID=UPI002FCC27D8
MKPTNNSTNLLHIGNKIQNWYTKNARDLPFRNTKDPFKIWICEIIFQQTRIAQGLGHYNRFIDRFPNVETLADADENEVILHWKGLGYYSRAINIHKASKQIMSEFSGKFPSDYDDILTLKGVGKYTAAAISSICFGEKRPAVDGNFYRVLSRIFADNFDISKTNAFNYFSELAFLIMSENMGDFNQAMMDLGSEICKPKNPNCGDCPVREDCIANSIGKVSEFPVKTKKVKIENLSIKYYFVHRNGQFIIQQRGEDFIWKKLYEFLPEISPELVPFIKNIKTINHKLTHKNLNIEIVDTEIISESCWNDLIKDKKIIISNFEDSQKRSFPKPLENYIQNALKD